MEEINSGLAYELLPYLKVYKNGRVERLSHYRDEFVPPSIFRDLKMSVSSKDVVIVPQTGLSARLYLPKSITHTEEPQQKKKLPLLVYFHGGAFCTYSAFNPRYHDYLNSLVAEANVVAVSVEYRRAPENPLPVAYEDSWAALKWVLSHSLSDQQGHEIWLSDHVDFNQIILGGDSSGANIAHNMAIRAGITPEQIFDLKLWGVVLVHPHFWGTEPIGVEKLDMDLKQRVDKLWLTVCPTTTTGNDDPLINPATDPNLSRLGCNKVLVCVAEKDLLRDRGWFYYETLKKSGWEGVVEIMESKGEGHVFHLHNPSSENALNMMKFLVSFMHQDN
ncbi:hypothetical protein MKW98_018689 [Papaver atlanticum]|uniref:Alpha/beta hydrolase fold-3 domain-containing protein n=1 Tax=Papaver atlanticum TaxID=357466 RepID=A0AAD4T573_9MAGN|nr:hypothetical protein MKW98_018689 [Papaver atlanticum]